MKFLNCFKRKWNYKAEILTKEKAELHYETILQNNENNIKSLISNINIALENKGEIIVYGVVK